MGLCTLHAGPYCSLCASGYFRKGKTCAPCDDGTKNVMYANLAADCGAPGDMLCDYRVFMCARLGLTAGFIGAFLLGVFVVHPKIVFAVFDFMAERPPSRLHAHMHAKPRTH